MIELLVTGSGHRLGIGRIHRDVIDRFAADNPEPEPPLKTAAELGIEIWGGFEKEELIPDWENPAYLESAKIYNLSFWNSRLENIAPAITILSELTPADMKDAAALQEVGIVLDHVGLLRHVYLKSELDAARAVLSVLYNSTVTLQGIREAGTRFAVRWNKKPVPVDVPVDSPLQTGREFSDRRSAGHNGYNWPGFCELTGPEQSALVAFHRLDVRINNIQYRAMKSAKR